MACRASKLAKLGGISHEWHCPVIMSLPCRSPTTASASLLSRLWLHVLPKANITSALRIAAHRVSLRDDAHGHQHVATERTYPYCTDARSRVPNELPNANAGMNAPDPLWSNIVTKRDGSEWALCAYLASLCYNFYFSPRFWCLTEEKPASSPVHKQLFCGITVDQRESFATAASCLPL